VIDFPTEEIWADVYKTIAGDGLQDNLGRINEISTEL
jgi:hypothetical protein